MVKKIYNSFFKKEGRGNCYVENKLWLKEL